MHIEGVEILTEVDVEKALRKKFLRIANELDFSEKAIEKYEKTIQADVDLVKKGKRPNIVVGARAYIISLLIREPRTQVKIARATPGSEAAIRHMYQDMTGRRKSNVRNRHYNID